MKSSPQFILFGEPEVPAVNKDVTAVTIAGQPEQKVWLYEDNQATASRFGVWDCNAGTFRAKMDGIIEFCCIIEGEAEITNLADGSKRTVRAGDAFVMEPGLELEWDVPAYIKKYFAISDVKDSNS